MMKTVLSACVSTLGKISFRPPHEKAMISAGILQQFHKLHLTGCHMVLDKDHPQKKAADKLRSETEETLRHDDLDLIDLNKFDSMFPSLETHAMLINGVRFDELPVIYIKATHNNTILTATDGKGRALANASAGTVGFRNARKGTTIAAQAAAISLAGKAIKNGIDLARISVQGIGPGRLPAIKGLQMSGITIVSITDATPLPHNGHRPKKQRRL